MTTQDPAPVRIALVDDEQLVRAGLAMIFRVDPRIEVVGEAADGLEAVELVARVRPAVVLMDIQMPRLDGIEATRRIAAVEQSPAVLMLTTFSDSENVLACLQAGATGFLLKNSDPEDLAQAVMTAAAGHSPLAPEVARPIIERLAAAENASRVVSPTCRAALDLLTDRERDVLRLVAAGRSNREIADALYVGAATVKTHVSSCLSKLQLRDRVQLVVFAYESGFVDTDAPG